MPVSADLNKSNRVADKKQITKEVFDIYKALAGAI